MQRIEMYGKSWEIFEDEKLGQMGLIAENHYRPLFDPKQREKSLTKVDIWLDIGANIGAFSVRAAEYVAGVIALEPEFNCVQQLRNNLQLNGVKNVKVIEAAVIEDDRTSVQLALSNSFSSTHRVGKIRGRRIIEVPAININTLMEDYSINKIKMDCEGSEVDILEAIDLEPIEEIIFEYHFSFIKNRPWERYFAILKKLQDNGMTILRGTPKESRTWHTIVWATKQ